MEYNKAFKVEGVSNLYAIMEWPGIQFFPAFSTMINDIGMRFNFDTYIGRYEDGDLYF